MKKLPYEAYRESFLIIDDCTNGLIPSASIAKSADLVLNNPMVAGSYNPMKTIYEPEEFYRQNISQAPNIKIATDKHMEEFWAVTVEISEKVKQYLYDAIILPLRGPYPYFKQIEVMAGIDSQKVLPMPFTREFKSISFVEEALKPFDGPEIKLLIIDTGDSGSGFIRIMNLFKEYCREHRKTRLRIYFFYVFRRSKVPNIQSAYNNIPDNLSISRLDFPVSDLVYEDFNPALGMKNQWEDRTIIYKAYSSVAKIYIIGKDFITEYSTDNIQEIDKINSDFVNRELFEEKGYKVFVR